MLKVLCGVMQFQFDIDGQRATLAVFIPGFGSIFPKTEPWLFLPDRDSALRGQDWLGRQGRVPVREEQSRLSRYSVYIPCIMLVSVCGSSVLSTPAAGLGLAGRFILVCASDFSLCP